MEHQRFVFINEKIFTKSSPHKLVTYYLKDYLYFVAYYLNASLFWFSSYTYDQVSLQFFMILFAKVDMKLGIWHDTRICMVPSFTW